MRSFASKRGRLGKGRPVDPETGWKPILHCAVAVASLMMERLFRALLNAPKATPSVRADCLTAGTLCGR
jgi:hypothetical protein